MKKLALTTAALALAAPAAFAQDTVRMGTEGAYPPYNFINDAGEVDGFERDLGDELCARADLDCEWVTNDFDSIIPNLVSGNYDTIIAGMTITDERDEVIDFTQAYIPPDPSAYLAPTDTELDPESGVIAAQTNTIQSAYVADSGATLVEFATPDETIAAVRNGQADAVLLDSAYLEPIADESDDLEIKQEVSIGGGIGMGLRESDTDLKKTFDEAIASMKQDGSLNDLITEWFGEDVETW